LFRPHFKLDERLERTADGHYLVHIRNTAWLPRYAFAVTVAAQLIIPMDNRTDTIVGIPIEAESTNNVNHIPALGPARNRLYWLARWLYEPVRWLFGWLPKWLFSWLFRWDLNDTMDNRSVYLRFKKLTDHSKGLLPARYRGEWTGEPDQVLSLLQGVGLGADVRRKPVVWIYVDGFDAVTRARRFEKRSYSAVDFTAARAADRQMAHAIDV
jgi:hypothetical protein